MKRKSGDDNTNDATDVVVCQATPFRPPLVPISTGIGYLDHMLDQFYSHAQIGLSLQIDNEEKDAAAHNDDNDDATKERLFKNRHANNKDTNQIELLSRVGALVGRAIAPLLLSSQVSVGAVSEFACPLDEALTNCRLVFLERPETSPNTTITVSGMNSDGGGALEVYTMSPYGVFPKSTGRTRIGQLETRALQSFWTSLARHSGLGVRLEKIRGDNAHHIVESSFKAFCRALRNLLDGVDTNEADCDGNTTKTEQEDAIGAAAKAASPKTNISAQLYGSESQNYIDSIALHRTAVVTRKTKETSIAVSVQWDGGTQGVQILTGIATLDRFWVEMATAAQHLSLGIQCEGDLWIDEHHTAEDVAIAVGQVLNESWGTKAGLTRMWCATASVESATVRVVMDLSNRPCMTHNFHAVLEAVEYIGDLTTEMFLHVLESLVVNARMTVHIVSVDETGSMGTRENGHTDNVDAKHLLNIVVATARAFGQALKYCSMIDTRRAGTTASSKGTLSV